MSKKELKKKIRDEIKRTGYPLELKVERVLRSMGMYVASSIFFTDRDTGKGREMDIRALDNYRLDDGAEKLFIRNCYIIECKKSDDPWVVFSSERSGYDDELNRIPENNKLGFSSIESILRELNKTNIHPFIEQRRHGRSYHVPFGGSDGVPYSALMSSAKATIETRDAEFSSGSNSIVYYYPIVILKGRLFEAHLSAQNEMVVEEGRIITVSFYYESSGYEGEKFIIPIVTYEYFQILFERLRSVKDLIGQKVESEY